MTPNEFYTKAIHCPKNEDGKYHGLYQGWNDNGTICWQAQINHGKCHGESKFFREDGSLQNHRWYEHDKLILDFTDKDKYPSTEEDRLIFKQKYQGEFLPN